MRTGRHACVDAGRARRKEFARGRAADRSAGRIRAARGERRVRAVFRAEGGDFDVVRLCGRGDEEMSGLMPRIKKAREIDGAPHSLVNHCLSAVPKLLEIETPSFKVSIK